MQIVYFGGDTPTYPREIQIYDANTDPIPVSLSRTAFSNTVKLPSSASKLYFFDSSVSVDTTDREVLISAPSVNLPRGSNKVLLLAFPDKENKHLPIRVLAIAADDNVFGNGEMLHCNFSNNLIKGTLGSSEIALRPKQKKMVEDPSPTPGKSYVAKLNAYERGDKTGVRLVRSKWRNILSRRILTIYYNKPETNEVTFKSYPIRGL